MKFCSIQLELSSLTGKNETLDSSVKESSSCDLVQKNESLLNITLPIKKDERLPAVSLPSKPSVDKETVRIPSKQSVDKETLEPIDSPAQTNVNRDHVEKNLLSSVSDSLVPSPTNEQPVNRETLEPSVTAKRVVGEFVKQDDKEGKLLLIEFVAIYNNFFF